MCANPDLVVHRGAELIYCAGALAQAYEALGGETVYAGKPYPPIYEAALARIAALRGEAIPRARVLAIGDALRTDLAGAAAMGLDALFVADGIHRDELYGPARRPTRWSGCSRPRGPRADRRRHSRAGALRPGDGDIRTGIAYRPGRRPGLAGAVYAIGNFDGVHLGHAAVIARTRALAAARGAPSAVLTFEPHPADYFAGRPVVFRLTR